MRLLRCVFPILLMAALAAGQEIDTVFRQGRDETQKFEKAGGKPDDPNHPVLKSVETLWAMRKDSPRAASEAIHLLVHASRYEDVYARASQIPPADPAWETLANVLYEAGSLQKDFTRFFTATAAALAAKPPAKVSAAIELSIGRAWRDQKDDEKAKAALQRAIDLAPASTAGRDAETALYELLHLSPGQPAPPFTAKAVDGSNVSLADFRSEPVVLVFWATH